MQTPVAIIMGSDSDWPLMKKAAQTLTAFHIAFDVHVLSAHRTPEAVRDYVRDTAPEQGVCVFIGAAGKAAHLPGVIASHTTRPVIGVPVRSSLDGMDALLSIAQMPSGIPVATVAIDGAENAALLALQILALNDPALAERLDARRKQMAEAVAEKDRAIRTEASAFCADGAVTVK